MASSLGAISQNGLTIDGAAINVTLDTAGLEKSIKDLKPSVEQIESQKEFYDSHTKVAKFKATPLKVQTAPATDNFPAEFIEDTPMSLEASKHAQDYAYTQSKHSFEYDEEDFDNPLEAMPMPSFVGVESVFDAASAFPDYSSVNESEFKNMTDLFKNILSSKGS